ncbi:hypothetical protein [Actinomadura kijaniata]|uniref:hypothetical protein n=1 Tax=Actinomadura kijaniata TaxID=46161 RepID=UPI0008327D17|nr:hypothetical protein [Actinomadura kijaniata]
MSPTSTIPMSRADLAKVLFTTRLQPSDRPRPEQVRAAVDDRLHTCGGDPITYAGLVAQEAGDHPETYAPRMRWALATVAVAYADRMLTAA